MPIISGHRGYKGKYPENTQLGFDKCFATGATHFETDLYLTADNVIVISHDNNTKRVYCYPNGDEADFVITKSSYEHDLKTLVNKQTGDKLLTFKHLLRYLMAKEAEDKTTLKQCMLDIKIYNKPKIMSHIVEEMLLVNNNVNYWLPKLQFGIWDLSFVKYMNQQEYFQKLYEKYNITEKFQVYHISSNWRATLEYLGYNHYLQETYGDERRLFMVNGVSLLYLLTWSQDFLLKFMPVVKMENISLFTWTVNSTYQYDYFNRVCKVYNLEHYGVMSDDPGMMMDHKLKGHHSEKSSQVISLDFQQKMANFVYELIIKFIPPNTATHHTPVDPEATIDRPVNPLFLKLFLLCQAVGLM